MKLFRSLGGALCLAILVGMMVASVPAGAQSLTALSLERSLSLNNILTTITPTGLSTTALAAIAAGSLDVREQTNLNPSLNTLTSTVFVVPTGAPNPTNLSQLPVASLVATTTMGIDRIYINSKPTPSVLIVGSIINSSVTPYGNYLGDVGEFSFGYTSDKPPKINNVIETFAGSAVIYSAASSGTFTITGGSSGGTGGGGTGVSPVVNGIAGTAVTITTTVNQVILDASASTSSNAGALTYAWSVTNGSASITGANTKTATIQLGSGKIPYTIKLVITDATGATATVTVTVNFV